MEFENYVERLISERKPTASGEDQVLLIIFGFGGPGIFR